MRRLITQHSCHKEDESINNSPTEFIDPASCDLTTTDIYSYHKNQTEYRIPPEPVRQPMHRALKQHDE